MSRAERYLAREVIPVFFTGVALYVGLFLVQTLLARSAWLGALPATATVKWLAYQVPDFAVRAFPLAIVLAVLLGFGRLARDHELIALQTSGVSLGRVLRPVVAFAFALVAAGLLLSEFVVPVANERVKVTWWDSTDGGGNGLKWLAGKELAIGAYTVRFTAYDVPTRELRDVRLVAWDGHKQTVYLAPVARFEGNNLTMTDFRGHTIDWDRVPVTPQPNAADAFTFYNSASQPGAKLTFELEQSRDTTIARNTEGGFEDTRSISALWHDYRASAGPGARQAGVLLAMRTAVPFASLVILLLAVPLAVSSTRSTGATFGMALLVTLAYYLAFAVGQALGVNGLVPPLVGPWLANVAFAAAGALMLRGARFR